MNNYKSGNLAELFARIYMRFHGYQILSKNYVTGKGTHAGEVDFIAKLGKTIAFVEVKKRKDIDSAAYSLTERQKQRVRRGAEAYLKHNPHFQNYDIRFDAVLVEFPFTILHFRDAF